MIGLNIDVNREYLLFSADSLSIANTYTLGKHGALPQCWFNEPTLGPCLVFATRSVGQYQYVMSIQLTTIPANTGYQSNSGPMLAQSPAGPAWQIY